MPNLEDMDVLELEARARALGRLCEHLEEWSKAIDSSMSLLTALTFSVGLYDVFSGKSPWGVLITFVSLYVICFVFDGWCLIVARHVVNSMRKYVDRREELFNDTKRGPVENGK